MGWLTRTDPAKTARNELAFNTLGDLASHNHVTATGFKIIAEQELRRAANLHQRALHQAAYSVADQLARSQTNLSDLTQLIQMGTKALQNCEEAIDYLKRQCSLKRSNREVNMNSAELVKAAEDEFEQVQSVMVNMAINDHSHLKRVVAEIDKADAQLNGQYSTARAGFIAVPQFKFG